MQHTVSHFGASSTDGRSAAYIAALQCLFLHTTPDGQLSLQAAAQQALSNASMLQFEGRTLRARHRVFKV